MKRSAVAVVLLCLAVGCTNDPKDQAIRQERDKFQGKWKQVSVEMKGDVHKLPDDVSVIMTIDGNKWKIEVNEGSSEGTFTIDPHQNPKVIDIFPNNKEAKEKQLVDQCIYKIEGDVLTICSGQDDIREANWDTAKPRPKVFKTTEGGMIFVHQRVKE